MSGDFPPGLFNVRTITHDGLQVGCWQHGLTESRLLCSPEFEHPIPVCKICLMIETSNTEVGEAVKAFDIDDSMPPEDETTGITLVPLTDDDMDATCDFCLNDFTSHCISCGQAICDLHTHASTCPSCRQQRITNPPSLNAILTAHHDRTESVLDHELVRRYHTSDYIE